MVFSVSSSSKLSTPIRYALIPFAAIWPRPIASTTEDGPVSTSPAANTPFNFVLPCSFTSILSFPLVIFTFPIDPTSGFAPTAGTIKSAFITNSLPFIGIGLFRPDSSGFPSFALKNSMPVAFLFFTIIFLGMARVFIFTPSFFASFISSVSAGISLIPRRYARVTFFVPNLTADLATSKAVDPPPITTTSPLTFIGILVLILFKNNRGSTTPSAFSPLILMGSDLGDPSAMSMAEKPFLNRVFGSLICFSVIISIPNPLIQSISLFNILLGRRYGGMA